MHEPLLKTKFFIPQSTDTVISRPRLLSELDAGTNKKLTLICAPAGFGKSTLLSDWISRQEQKVAWLSLEEGDSEPVRFFTYLIAAIRETYPEMLSGAWGKLDQSIPFETDVLLTELISELHSSSENICLVLDDYHRIDSVVIDKLIVNLIDHHPENFYLFISTREDPNIPLAKLRAKRQLSEIRAEDLRFVTGETQLFLDENLDVKLPAEDVEALASRTEGWITGLQLAAISMNGIEDKSQFIHSFTGSHRFVLDYLIEEVLDRLPEEVHKCLLYTSILSQFNVSLCAAVVDLDRAEAHDLLSQLERANLLLIPLDDTRTWYRYHHLFGDALLARLRAKEPDLEPTLHLKAGEWFETEQEFPMALKHFMQAGSFERSADLAELIWSKHSIGHQSITWHSWIKDLPLEIISERPVLCLACAWSHLNNGDLENAGARLSDLGKIANKITNYDWSLEAQDNQKIIKDFPISLASAQAYYSQAIGDVKSTIRFCDQLLSLIPDEDNLNRSTAFALRALAYWENGDLFSAQDAFVESFGYGRTDGSEDIITGAFVVADIQMTLGLLSAANDTCLRAIEQAEKLSPPTPMGVEDAYSGLSYLNLLKGDIAAAEGNLNKCKELGEQVDLPDWRYRWCIAQATFESFRSNFKHALALLEEAEQVFVRTPLPVIRPIAAIRARIHIKQGKFDRVRRWISTQNLNLEDELTFKQEFEHITLLRLLVQQFTNGKSAVGLKEIDKFIDRLLSAAEAGQRQKSVIELLILKGILAERAEKYSEASKVLGQAVELAEREGFVQPFLEEGAKIEELLPYVLEDNPNATYATVLLEFLQKPSDKMITTDSGIPIPKLSSRELEVLQLIAQGLSNREIGQKLFIAIPTIKGHNLRIFEKLGVKRRTEAVIRAQELGLL